MAMGVEVKLTGMLNEVIRIPQGQNFFPGNSLPSPFVADGVYVPTSPSFPAVDMVWKFGNQMFGVQVHTSKTQKDVLDNFMKMCQSAGWMSESQHVFLLYLCPFKDCTVLFAPNDGIEEKDGITIEYITRESLPCLDSLHLVNHGLYN